MPTYTYECPKCGWSKDKFHSMNTSPRVRCKECGATCKRLLGMGAGIIFKGSGFYETDYKRSSSKSSKAEGDSEPKPKSDSESSKGASSGKKDGGDTSSSGSSSGSTKSDSE